MVQHLAFHASSRRREWTDGPLTANDPGPGQCCVPLRRHCLGRSGATRTFGNLVSETSSIMSSFCDSDEVMVFVRTPKVHV